MKYSVKKGHSYARNLCSRAHLAMRARNDRVSCIQRGHVCGCAGHVCGLYARYLCSRDALGLNAAARPSARATIGYLVYKCAAVLVT